MEKVFQFLKDAETYYLADCAYNSDNMQTFLSRQSIFLPKKQRKSGDVDES